MGRQGEGRLKCLVALLDIAKLREHPEVGEEGLFGLDIEK